MLRHWFLDAVSVATFMRRWAWFEMVGLYLLMASGGIINGAFREIAGSTSQKHKRMHALIIQWHTGSHIHPLRTYGDERRLKRTAAGSSRATPEGAIVYFSKLKRPQRATVNNAITLLCITALYGLLFQTRYTMVAMTIAFVLSLYGAAFLFVRRLRKRVRLRAPKILKLKALARPEGFDKPEPVIVAGGQLLPEKPQLIGKGSIPVEILSALLAEPIGCSKIETAGRVKLEPNKGRLALPDHFPALPKQREVVEDIIRAQSQGQIGFTWQTDTVPREVTWKPVITALPTMALFRDYEKQMQALPHGVFGVGVVPSLDLFSVSHRGDTPWHLDSMGSGSGKSTKFQIKLAQICYQDPKAQVYCVDTKQISFYDMHGIPGVHIYDNPESEMEKIWRVFGIVHDEMRNRYKAIREHQARIEDFDDCWVLVDEGNDLASHLKGYYDGHVKERGDPAQPTIWSEKVQPLINLGRQVGIRGEFMFQNMTDKALGGVSLRDAFGVTAMAAYKKNQWTRIIGSKYQEAKNGPGKMCIVQGPSEQWVQGLYDDPTYLREYAMARRK